MDKFSIEEKIEAVRRALNGNESYGSIAKSIGADPKSLAKWLKQYEYNGVE